MTTLSRPLGRVRDTFCRLMAHASAAGARDADLLAPAAGGERGRDEPADAPDRGEADAPLTKGWLRRSLRTSVSEGMLAEVFMACAGGAALTGWALHLGFRQGTVGLLCAAPVAAQVFHLPAAILTERIGRRRLSLVAVGLSRLSWLALPVLAFADVAPDTARAVLVAVVAVSSVLGAVGNNAWVVWMGDLVPPSMQGRYFGRRTAALTLVGCVGALLTGVILDRARQAGRMDDALAMLAVVAGLAGLGCLLLLHRQQDRRRAPRPCRPVVATLLAPLRDPALRPLLAYQAAWNAAVGVAASFFVVYLVRDLGMSFAFVAGHAAVAAAARMLAAPLWGRALDRVGPERVLLVTGLGMAVLPLFWVAGGPGRVWPLAVDAIAGGALSAGHGLALFGLPLRVAPRRDVASYVGALSSAGGGAFALACLSGGVLATRLPERFHVGGHGYFALDALFVAAALARACAACLAWRPRPAEARAAPGGLAHHVA